METAIINTERDSFVSKAIKSEQKKLFGFIRKRVRTEEDAEDILQDVFYQLLASYSITEPIEKITSWLFKVASNKIIDWYRKRKHSSEPIRKSSDDFEDEYTLNLEDMLFDPADNPDEVYTRSLIWEEIMDALDELPDEQSSVFVMHELEGKSFSEMAELTGEKVSTLLSRKRYVVLYLRERLEYLYIEMKNL